MWHLLAICSVVVATCSGDPLLLTPYIEQGNIEEGRKAALVPPILPDIVSYSGFLTVDKRYNSNLFFWFFPAEVQNDTAPLLLWLQGGPGTSSLLGVLKENGPIHFTTEYKLLLREYRWTKTMNVLYIDNPVGAGFSFTGNEKGYSVGQAQIADNLYTALQQFFTLFPEYRARRFYLTGESYAGRYTTSIASAIDQNNRLVESNRRINLQGLIVISGFFDRRLIINYADYLYEIGLVDVATREEIRGMQTKIVELIDSECYAEATDQFNEFMVTPYANYFYRKTGFTFRYNYLYTEDYIRLEDIFEFAKIREIRDSLHVGNSTFYDQVLVKQYLKEDYSKTVKTSFESLLENYRVVILNGQLDMSEAYPLNVDFVRALNWTGAGDYLTAERHLWYVDNELAGYAKTVANFTEILVRNAGHLVPHDQPKWAYDAVERVVNDVPFQ